VFYNLTTGFEEPPEESTGAAQQLADEEAEAARGPVGPSQAVYAIGGQPPSTFQRLGYESEWVGYWVGSVLESVFFRAQRTLKPVGREACPSAGPQLGAFC
jgi:hypothetical protein